jgi:hypothetical protein
MDKQSKEKTNAKQVPKVYYARHIEEGLVGYLEGTVLVRNEALKKMNPTFEGRPLYIGHQDVDLENIQEESGGYVVESFYNRLDGKHWLKFIAVSDEAHDCISKGWGVSNAYIPLLSDNGGVYHNIPYDAEVLSGEYTHLAIVDNPRYEDASIFTQEEFKAYNEAKKKELDELQLHNSKTNGGRSLIMKFFKKTEVKEAVDMDTIVELENGKEVKLSDMIDALANEAEKEKEKEKKKDESYLDNEVDVAGSKMSVKELISKYENMCKKNAEDEEKDKKELEEKEKEARENALKEEELKKLEAEKEKKHFDDLNNAIENGKESEAVFNYETVNEKIARGKEKY